jgi:hypothetical protein
MVVEIIVACHLQIAAIIGITGGTMRIFNAVIQTEKK